MPQEVSLLLQARPSADESAAEPFAPASDRHSEPTICSMREVSALTQPTCVDPDAPIHHGAVPVSTGDGPTGGNHAVLPPGYTLHEYTIEAVLGSGGFGITYLARDNNLQCQVAIKEYLPGELAVRAAGQTVCPRTDSDTHGYKIGLERFLSETRVLAGFRHPNIIRVVRFFEANNTAYMVMDYEKGRSLREWMNGHGPVEEALLLRMFVPLLEGLGVVHKSGVLHRDIKPANIYVRESDGSLVLLDFGAARQAGDAAGRSLTSIVTPGYAPFEQYHTRGAQGPWSDLYSFGGVLYWLVTGEKPLEAPSRVKSDAMPSALSMAAGRYSENLLRAIDWALTPEEADRPMSVALFQAALTGQEAASTAAVPVERPASVSAEPARAVRRSGLSLALGATGAVLLLGAVAFAYYPGQDKRDAESQAQASLSVETLSKEEPKTGKSKTPEAVKRRKTPIAAPVPERTVSTEMPVANEATVVPAAYVLFVVTPRGEVVVDGKKAGISPPLGKLRVSPGEHKVEIHSYGAAPPHYWTLNLKAGETREIRANFGANSSY